MSKLEVVDTATLFNSIQGPFEAAFDRHISRTKRDTLSLNPYELVPLESYPELAEAFKAHVKKWADAGIDIMPIIKSVLLVDTATEANLPWYTSHIEDGFRPWHDWNARWTTEERSHEEIMVRDIEARGILDMSTEWLPVREQNMLAGIHPEVVTPAEGIAYVATQELLTRMAHFRSARIMDKSGAGNLRAIGGDEGRHYQFYVDLLRALGGLYPDIALIAMQRQHEGNKFAMPGQKGIPGFKEHSLVIAAGGIFDLVTVLEAQKQTIEDAKLLDATPITDEGKQAQEWAAGIAEGTDPYWERKGRIMERLRDKAAQGAEVTELRPFILGRTVELVSNNYEVIAA